MSKSQLQIDLSRKLQEDVDAAILRNVVLAQTVMPTGQVMLMMIELAVSTVLTTAATVAASVNDGADPGEAFDRMPDAIAGLARQDRARSLAAVVERRAGAPA